MIKQRKFLELAQLVKLSAPHVLSIMMEDEGELAKEFEQRWKLKTLPKGCKNPSHIKQGLLYEKPGFYMRIRKETKNDKSIYTLTLKFFEKSDESEVEITQEMFEKLWPDVDKTKIMEKTRYRHGDWEIDDITAPENKIGIVAEIETSKKNQKIEKPDDWDVEKKFEYD